MNYNEYEKNQLLIFLLPAVIGGLTLLFARRWGNSPASTTSTAISRRRKIIKDTLIKKPHMFTKLKVMESALKNHSTYNKKVNSMCEEDMAPGRRMQQRPPRYSSVPLTTNTTTEPVINKMPNINEIPYSPKHIPIPNLSHDSDIVFELMTFIFMSVAMGLQFMNIYRTIWWLPNSNTKHAMHFYLIDPHVICFIMIMISRHLLYSAFTTLLKYILSTELIPHAMIASRMFILGVILGALGWCVYFITMKHNLLNVFYLCYPAFIYILLFGLQASPFLELSNGDRPILHNCSSNPQSIKTEVDYMKADFNLRIKKIMFVSVTGAYYTSFIPCVFAQSFVKYEWKWAAQQVGIVWSAMVSRVITHMLPTTYTDALHRASLHLYALENYVTPTKWQVQYGRFYMVFKNPASILCIHLTLLLSSILIQLSILFCAYTWTNYMSIGLLVMTNYYTVYQLMRDYMITFRIYKTEAMIHQRSTDPVT